MRRTQAPLPLFSTVERQEASRFRAAFLVALLAQPATADAIRDRLGIIGTNFIGAAVRGMNAAGLLQVAGFTEATAKKARGRLTRTWELSAKGRALAARLAAAQGGPVHG